MSFVLTAVKAYSVNFNDHFLKLRYRVTSLIIHEMFIDFCTIGHSFIKQPWILLITTFPVHYVLNSFNPYLLIVGHHRQA